MSTRYFDVGVTTLLWTPSLANYFAPSRAELNAAIELTSELASIDGWVATSDQIDVPPDLGLRYQSALPGFVTHEDSKLSFWADRGGLDARTLMPEDQSGFVIWMDGGDVPGYKMEVYPVRVRSVGKYRSGDDAARITICFSIYAEPQELVVPA
jgi:hypothetical protein